MDFEIACVNETAPGKVNGVHIFFKFFQIFSNLKIEKKNRKIVINDYFLWNYSYK